MILLDTHVWLWWLLEEGDLDESERAILDEQALNGEIFISAVTIWEAELLYRQGDLELLPILKHGLFKLLTTRFVRLFQ